MLVLTETWLNNCIHSSELFDQRYIVFRRDRETSGFHAKKEGGGVLVAVSRKYAANRQCSWESGCEDLWVTVSVATGFKIAICALYLPPPVHYSILEHFLDGYNAVAERNDYCTILILYCTHK